VPTVPAKPGGWHIGCAKNFQRPPSAGNLILQNLLILQRFSAVCAVGIAQAKRKVLDKPNI